MCIASVNTEGIMKKLKYWKFETETKYEVKYSKSFERLLLIKFSMHFKTEYSERDA